ncbi:hypothetical protein Mal64_30520 [Pseudobythopirellula maris]|uniref:Methanolan biosynthesis EpsI domain-containing protein n=1 Tax=Pseudobythopirellula maris TaxID=2527991 RepID=A0A5C5ZL29_9BACT|nr:exosortase-associated EpsI family protein [Pseudobythopirellula maris]TWT87511.1 hypothetical protein Mal64_30520 [Pseudobythopirellula maris]
MSHRNGVAYSSVITAMALTLFSGAMFGAITQRWGMSQDSIEAASKLASIPQQFGDWQAIETEPIDQYVCQVLRLQGHLKQQYRNSRTGEMVEVYLVLGPAGPISVHQPEICFKNHAYKQRSERELVAVGSDQSQQMWSLIFDPSESNLDGEIVRVYYGWTHGGELRAPEDARLAFVGSSHLYKLQVTCQLPPTADLERQDPCGSFLRDFLPVLKPCLNPADSLVAWN